MLPRCLLCLFGGLLLSAGLSAATYPAPTFYLYNTINQNQQYTNSQTVDVKLQTPANPKPSWQWCISQHMSLTGCKWVSLSSISPFSLQTTGDGGYKVFLTYRISGAASGTGSAVIRLDTSVPVATVNSPIGFQGSAPEQEIFTNWQSVNFAVTPGINSKFPADPVNVTVDACPATGSCSTVYSTNGAYVAPASLQSPVEWLPIPGESYITMNVMNGAGTTAKFNIPQTTPSFMTLTPPTGSANVPPYLLTCSNSPECPVLASQNLTNFPGSPMTCDPASASVNGITNTGYADPSMRRDLTGSTLWMLYSYPEVQPDSTQVVEIHYASSADFGSSWAAPYTGSCATNLPTTAVPVWPSLSLSAVPPSGGWSSHEVANFWPDPVNSMWYAVHLMYFVPSGGQIAPSITGGCLVTTVASTPGGLATGWTAADNPPSACPGTNSNLFSGNTAITFDSLTTTVWAHDSTLLQQCPPLPSVNHCIWGEPAIMVQHVGGVATAYLAVSASTPFVQTPAAPPANYGYFIFTNTLDTNGQFTNQWQYFGGPITLADLNVTFNEPPPDNQPTFLTEFDWAQRSDSSSDLVAVFSPATFVPPKYGEEQFGCIAVNFTLIPGEYAPQTSTTPFGNLIASVTDALVPPSGDGNENLGPNACTYEPTANSGIVLVRRLVNSPTNFFAVSMLNTGIMP